MVNNVAFCPFCRSNRVGYVPKFSDDFIVVHGHVKCFNCNAQGPAASTEAEAWELWNQLLENENADFQKNREVPDA